MFSEPPVTALQDKVNESVDAAKSDLHRVITMGIVFLIGVAAWVVARAILVAAVSAWLIFHFHVSWELVAGIRVSAVVVAYLCVMLTLGIFLVSAFSIPLWGARYRSLVTPDADYQAAKRQWNVSFWLWLGMLLLIVPITLLIIFNPYAILP